MYLLNKKSKPYFASFRYWSTPEWNKVSRYCLNTLEEQHPITCFRALVIYSQAEYIS